MSDAERQRRHRQRHKARRLTVGEEFRLKLYRLIREYGWKLSADEISETLDSYGRAWGMDHYCLVEKAGLSADRLTWDQSLLGELEYMDRVFGGDNMLCGTLGDEERYRHRGEKARREREEWDANFKAEMEALARECGGDEEKARQLSNDRLVGQLQEAIAGAPSRPAPATPDGEPASSPTGGKRARKGR
jgi:hypothetical protein